MQYEAADKAARRRPGAHPRRHHRKAHPGPARHSDHGRARTEDFVSDTWNAISAPPKTPAPIIAKLNLAVNDVLKSRRSRSNIASSGLQIGGGTPQDMAKIVKADTARWGEVIKEANIPQL